MISQLIDAVGSYQTVTTYVDEGGMAQLLGVLGGVHFEAAEKALERVDRAREPTAHIWSAANHLEVAHVAFRRGWRDAGFLSRRFREVSMQQAAIKDVYAIVLLIVCFLALDEINAAQKLFVPLREANHWVHHEAPEVSFWFLNPDQWAEFFRHDYVNSGAEDEIEEFIQRTEALITRRSLP